MTDGKTGEKKIFSTMLPGSFFGEIALLDEENRRSCDVQALFYTDVSVLSRKQLLKVFDKYLDHKELFQAISDIRKKGSGKSTKEIVEEAARYLNLKEVRGCEFYILPIFLTYCSCNLLPALDSIFLYRG